MKIRERDVKWLAGFIRKSRGISFPEYSAADRTAIYGLILKNRMHEIGILDSSRYRAGIRDLETEARCIASHLKIQRTSFFRERESIQTMLGALPERNQIRACSLGCATGEEAYTLAIALRLHRSGMRFNVSALDMSAPVIAYAKIGAYPVGAVHGKLNAVELRAGFAPRRPREKYIHVKESLRRRVSFIHGNVLGRVLEPGFDVVFCRHVLRYLDSPAKRKLWREIDRLSKPGTVFVIGRGEAMPRLNGEWERLSATVLKKLHRR